MGQAQKFQNDPAAIAVLLSENHTERARRRTAEAKVTELEGSLPGADAVVLPKAEADMLAAYRKLGKPDDVKTAMEQLPALQQDLAQAAREKLLARASVGSDGQNIYKSTVLAKVLDGVELQESTTDDGWQLQVALPGEGDEPTLLPVGEYLEKHQSDFLPAILVGGAAPKGTGAVGSSRPGTSVNGAKDWTTASKEDFEAHMRSMGVQPLR
jgi:hypothetical protein